jgi:DNA-binding NarL/FixJ family response regulator
MRRGVGPCDDGPVERTVLIVDDHPGFRSAARALLEADGFEVVGEAADGESGLAVAERLRPGLVLLDIQLPDLDGFAVARRLSQAGDPPVVVLVSSRDRSAYRRRLADSPARGFVAKSELSGAALSALLASG